MARAFYNGFYLYWQSAYFKAHYFDPTVGRFITADPTIPNMFSSQSFNRYMFVSGSPVNFMDDGGYKETCGNAEATTEKVASDKDDNDQYYNPDEGNDEGDYAVDFTSGGSGGNGGGSNKGYDYSNLYSYSAPVAYVSVPASVAPQSNIPQQYHPSLGNYGSVTQDEGSGYTEQFSYEVGKEILEDSANVMVGKQMVDKLRDKSITNGRFGIRNIQAERIKINLDIRAFKGLSKSAGPVSAVLLASDIKSDLDKYDGNDAGKAVLVTSSTFIASMLVGGKIGYKIGGAKGLIVGCLISGGLNVMGEDVKDFWIK